MSKYMTFPEVSFKDRNLLVDALQDIGCKEIRQGENLKMEQYYSEQLNEMVEIVIPRYTIGNRYGDIGFARTEKGEYQMVMDDIDQSKALDGEFIQKLRASYNEQVVKAVARKLNGTTHRTVEGGVVKIKVRY